MQCWLIKTRLNGYDAGRRFEASRQRGRLMNKQCAVNALWIINLHSRHGHRAPCISTGYPLSMLYDHLVDTHIREFMIHSWNRSYVEVGARPFSFFYARYKKKKKKEKDRRVKNNLSFTCTWEGRKRLHLPSIIFPSCSRILKIARYAPCAKKRESSRRRKRFT